MKAICLARALWFCVVLCGERFVAYCVFRCCLDKRPIAVGFGDKKRCGFDAGSTRSLSCLRALQAFSLLNHASHFRLGNLK
jgi:hypothetical protein